jgi:D-glycero-alpha-D-manno-heptose 1-phosphate guanylyltransferase
VGSRPFLEIQIRSLVAAGVNDVVLSLGHMSGQVIAAIDQRLAGIDVRHVVERELLGTGGAIAHVLDTMQLDEVIVANGDTYLDGDLTAMLAPLDRARGELFRMAVVEVPSRARFGGVELGAAGHVTRFLEKGQDGGGFINAGLYRLCRSALPCRRSGSYSLEVDVLPELVREQHVKSCVIHGSFIDIGVPEDYRLFCETHGQS